MDITEGQYPSAFIKKGPETTSKDNLTHRDASFECCCCYDLLVLPTTLTCGHSFCRPCLARWVKEHQVLECPMCRQTCYGKPKVNISLRIAIERLYPRDAADRQKEIEEDAETKKDIEFFDTFSSPSSSSVSHLPRALQNNLQGIVPNQARNTNFGLGLLMGLGLMLVLVLLAWFLLGWTSAEVTILKKPIAKWSTGDVGDWIHELGPWASPLQPTFEKKAIDGFLLISLEEDELDILIEQIDPLFQRTFKTSLSYAKTLGSKPPKDFWEYQELHMKATVMLSYGLAVAPRLTFLGLYLFDYEDSLLPIVHTVSPVWSNMSNVSLYCDKLPKPTTGQWIDIMLKATFFPYYVLGQFIWYGSLVATNPIIGVLWMVECLASTYREYVLLQQRYNDQRLKWPWPVRQLYGDLFNLIGGWCLLRFICPSLLSKLFFYYLQLGSIRRMVG